MCHVGIEIYVNSDELETLTRYVSEILEGMSIQELAQKESTTPEKIKEELEKLKKFNPSAYKMVMEYLRIWHKNQFKTSRINLILLVLNYFFRIV